MQAILDSARWAPLRASIDPTTTPAWQVLSADRFFDHLQARGAQEPSVEDCLAFAKDKVSAHALIRVERALRALLPGHPVLHVLLEAMRIKDAAYVGRDYGRPRPTRARSRRFSVAEAELPEEWRAALADMACGISRNGVKAPAPTIRQRMTMRLRQLAASAIRAGLEVALSVPAAQAYHRDASARGVRAATLRASFEEFSRFARYTGAAEDVRAALLQTLNTLAAKERRELPLKYAKAHEHGDRIADSLRLAEDLLARAGDRNHPRSGVADRNAACALALFSVLPLRLSDTRLRFGHELTWDGANYQLALVMQKTGRTFAATIDARLTRFIDALVLHGLDPVWLDERRATCIARGRALFVSSTGIPVAYNYVSDQWRKHIGTGQHIARTRIHNALGSQGWEGTRRAMAACGQVSFQTAKRYQTKSFADAAFLACAGALVEAFAHGGPTPPVRDESLP